MITMPIIKAREKYNKANENGYLMSNVRTSTYIKTRIENRPLVCGYLDDGLVWAFIYDECHLK